MLFLLFLPVWNQASGFHQCLRRYAGGFDTGRWLLLRTRDRNESPLQPGWTYCQSFNSTQSNPNAFDHLIPEARGSLDILPCWCRLWRYVLVTCQQTAVCASVCASPAVLVCTKSNRTKLWEVDCLKMPTPSYTCHHNSYPGCWIWAKSAKWLRVLSATWLTEGCRMSGCNPWSARLITWVSLEEFWMSQKCGCPTFDDFRAGLLLVAFHTRSVCLRELDCRIKKKRNQFNDCSLCRRRYCPSKAQIVVLGTSRNNTLQLGVIRGQALLCLAKIKLVSNSGNFCLSCRPFRLTDKIMKSSHSSESQWNSVRQIWHVWTTLPGLTCQGCAGIMLLLLLWKQDFICWNALLGVLSLNPGTLRT